MALTLIARPQDVTPAYNPIKWIVNSNIKNYDGFRYVFKIKDSLSNIIAEYRVLPTYGTGYGEQDLSKLLSNYVSFDLNTDSTTFYPATNSSYTYKIETGEEYTSQVNYTSTLVNSSGNVRINVTNTFVAGDRINIKQVDGGAANPYMEGLFTVLSATGSYLVINSQWSLVTNAAIDGTIIYADNRKTYVAGTEYTKKVFNGALRWLDFPTWEYDDFNLIANTKRWFTNQPTTFYSTLGQDIYLNAGNPSGNPEYVIFKNSNGEYFYKTISGTTPLIHQIPIGANNYGVLTPIGAATLPMIKTDTTYYEVYYSSANTGTPIQNSLKYKINLDTRVQISEYHCLFLDRMGSFSSFAFQLKNYERGEVTRDEYNKDVTGFINTLPSVDQWSYLTREDGFKTFNINVKKTIDLNTNWMTEEMNRYFEELITSPQVYLKLASYTNTENWLYPEDESGCPLRIPESTEYQPVIVTNNQYEIFQQRNKNLIKHSITVRLANQDNING
jgi:hypothetical protein